MNEDQKPECTHWWARRRDGVRCVYCDEVRFGVDDDERIKLNEMEL